MHHHLSTPCNVGNLTSPRGFAGARPEPEFHPRQGGNSPGHAFPEFPPLSALHAG